MVTNANGVVESTTTNTTLKSPLSSPMPKSAPSDDSPGLPQGDFKLRSYKLKKKGSKDCKFVCKSCGVVKPSVQELNDHHKRKHKQVMCGTCNKLFDAPLQLARHMYEHYEKTIECDCCDQCFTFQSKLEKHKVIHRKKPSFKCMQANCDGWFFQNQDLNFHLQTHKKTKMSTMW